MRRPRLLSSLPFLPLLATFAFACSGGTPDGSETSDDHLRESGAGATCAKHHVGATAEGDTVEICEELFDAAPRVRPPADTTTGDGIATMYVGMDGSGGSFVDRNGVHYVPLNEKGKPLTDKRSWNASFRAMRMPDNRNLYLVYKVVGKIAPYTDKFGEAATGITLSSAAPSILIAGKSIDALALGTWEGTTPVLAAGGRFDAATTTPVRITFASMNDFGTLHGFGSEGPFVDGVLEKVVGKIDNFDHAVKGSDGKCYPALSSLGDANPFKGATDGAIDLYRVAGMHMDGDQVLVMTMPKGTEAWSLTAMANVGSFQPASLVQHEQKISVRFLPHGTPMGNNLELHKLRTVTGGQGC